MKKLIHKKSVPLALILSAAAVSPAMADSEIEFHVGWFSDYIDNGESISDKRGVLQAGVEWAHDSGLFAGVEASTLGRSDGDNPGEQIIGFFGYATDLGLISVELGYEYVRYTKQDDEQEIFLVAGTEALAGFYTRVIEADDKDARGDQSYGFTGQWPLIDDWTLVGTLGYDDPKKESRVGFWELGVVYEFAPFDVSLSYASRDETGADDLWALGLTTRF